jgi:hypothetical protein
MQLPSHQTDDDQPDVCCPSKNIPFNLNQSFFHMLTAGTSNVRMSSRFDVDSDDEDDDEDDTGGVDLHDAAANAPAKAPERKPWGPLFSPLQPIEESGGGSADTGGDDSSVDLATQPGLGPAPIMSQILEAQAQMNPANFGAAAQEQTEKMFGQGDEKQGRKSSDLAKKLMEIFNLPLEEDVVAGKLRRCSHLSKALLLTVSRVSLLVAEKRAPSRVHVHHHTAHMLLCVSPEENCRLPPLSSGFFNPT